MSETSYTLPELVDNKEPVALVTKMPKRLRACVTINEKEVWLSGYTKQELFDSYVDALEQKGLIIRVEPDDVKPLLSEYIDMFYKTYKTHQQANTIVNRERIVRNHILPKFGSWRIDNIKTQDVQMWFNEMAKIYSKETIAKIKNIFSPVMDSAVEDGLIEVNPLRSRRIENNGRATIHHKALPHDKIVEIKSALPSLEPKLRYMGGLLAYTGMRYEEVLGARFEDISQDGWITVCRAVVHPERNQPVEKYTKTVASDRIIPCPEPLQSLLADGPDKGFILATDKDPTRETPMSYGEARLVYNKLQKTLRIREYTPHDFRDTCATEWRENGMSLDVIARLLGHAKTETTERRYVKYRPELLSDIRAMM